MVPQVCSETWRPAVLYGDWEKLSQITLCAQNTNPTFECVVWMCSFLPLWNFCSSDTFFYHRFFFWDPQSHSALLSGSECSTHLGSQERKPVSGTSSGSLWEAALFVLNVSVRRWWGKCQRLSPICCDLLRFSRFQAWECSFCCWLPFVFVGPSRLPFLLGSRLHCVFLIL